MWLLALLFGTSLANAQQDTTCARVKMQIKQDLALERQAFEAEMVINNTTDTSVLENVSIEVKVTDLNGTPVVITDDPNNLTAKFFVRLSNKQNIAAVDGTGTVNPKTTSTIDWLLIPAPGAAGSSPLGKKYLVGATLKYRNGGEDTVLDVYPAAITVKPLPLLTLDYFLTQNVWADDPLTPEIEPVEPFTLGVRVKNNGSSTAKSLKIDSAQPKIVENNQGLLINFKIDASYLNDAPAQNTLLIDFGDVAASTSKMGRWIMETSLAGKFTEFTASFSHADELGGTLTSILQGTNAHFLIRDVRVDLPGRDLVRDFLAQDGDVIRVYESDAPDSPVTDRSSVATFVAGTGSDGNASYQLTIPPTAGFVYVKLPDPFNGQKALGRVARADAKILLAENVWLSKTRNEQTKKWEYWVNFFDVNTSGNYDAEFQAPATGPLPPVIQLIPDRTTTEEKQVSFLVEASSPNGRSVTLSASPLPAGAKFTVQAADPQAPGVTRAIFDWTPAKGTAGNYPVNYIASDGSLSTTISANIKVSVAAPPAAPGTPTIVAPLAGAQITSLQPALSVQPATVAKDPTTKVQFEVYSDAALTQLVTSALVDKVADLSGNGGGSVAQPTAWQLTGDLLDNTGYWWRARAFDGTLYSPWANARFFVNLFNDPPDSFNLTSPVPNAEVSSLTPILSWTNSKDKDGDVITYSVMVYSDAALTTLITQATDLPENESGTTSWTVDVPLTNHGTYYWTVIAKDPFDAQTPASARSFLVNTGNTAPTSPVVVSPAVGGQSTTPSIALTIQNSTDAEHDPITYVFEVDTVNTFDSGDKKSSGQLAQNSSGNTSWTVTNLVENTRYWWRAKAQDGRAESAWVIGDFLMNAANEAPPSPTVKNPGNGAWSSSLNPSLEANPVLDPEGDPVSYQFEVYRDSKLSNKVADGTSSNNNTALIVPTALTDKTTYWWRVRALDPQNAASAWSSANVLYVSTATYQNPTISVIEPATIQVPVTVNTSSGKKKQVTIRWEGTDPNIEPTVALYYGTTNSGYAGTLIVDGLHQAAGTQSGSYVWDVTQLAPGAYYVYAVIYDAKGVGKAYAPGAVVIRDTHRTGSIVVTAKNNLTTDEGGATATFKVRLGNAPRADVMIPLSSSNPREGKASPASLTFTAQNWATDQIVTVTGQDDCASDGTQKYRILVGKAVSLDPDYIGLSGDQVNLKNADSPDRSSTTSNAKLFICGLTVVSSKKVDAKTTEYVLSAELTNTGRAIGGVTAKLVKTRLVSQVTAVDDTLVFGAVGSGETSKSKDTITLRSKVPLTTTNIFKKGSGSNWNVTIQP